MGSIPAASSETEGVERRAFVGCQLAPPCDRRVEVRSAGCMRSAGEVLERDIVRRDHSRARPPFNRHIADGHFRSSMVMPWMAEPVY